METKERRRETQRSKTQSVTKQDRQSDPETREERETAVNQGWLNDEETQREKTQHKKNDRKKKRLEASQRLRDKSRIDLGKWGIDFLLGGGKKKEKDNGKFVEQCNQTRVSHCSELSLLREHLYS